MMARMRRGGGENKDPGNGGNVVMESGGDAGGKSGKIDDGLEIKFIKEILNNL